MMAGSLASATADTLSSELGTLLGRSFYNIITFKKDQPQMQINLPESKAADAAPKAKTEPLILEVASAEKISLDGRPVTLDTLAASVKSTREKNPDRPIAMKADKTAPFGVVVKVLDALKEAGVKNIPAFTQSQDSK